MILVTGMPTSIRKKANIRLCPSQLDYMFFFLFLSGQLDKIIENPIPCALSLAPGSVSVTVSLTVMGSSKSMIYKINIVNAGYYGE
jgi:hypothetical protein